MVGGLGQEATVNVQHALKPSQQFSEAGSSKLLALCPSPVGYLQKLQEFLKQTFKNVFEASKRSDTEENVIGISAK